MRKSLCIVLTFALAMLSAPAPAQEKPPIYSLAKSIPIGGDGSWDYINLDPQRHLLYVPRTTLTQVIDLTAGKVVAEIPGFTYPHGVALVPKANRGFISDGKDASVTLFDLKTNAILGKIKIALDSDGIIHDPATDRILVVSGDGHSLYSFPVTIDPKDAKLDPPLELGGLPEYLAADGTGKAFINLQNTNEVVAVDTKAMKILARWPTAPGTLPTGMSMDAEKHRLFIGCRNGKIIVMNSDNGKVLADLPIGAVVDATAVDGPYALASCRDGTLTVIQETAPDHYQVVQTVKTAYGAATMVLDKSLPNQTTVYLVATDTEPARGTANPRRIPGTFKVLVVTRPPTATTKPDAH